MSKTQNFENHARYYPLHHFFIMPLAFVFLVWTVMRMDFSTPESTSESLYLGLLALIVVLISLLSRLYAIKNQNRIIRLEMRQRYFYLTGTPFYEKEKELSSAQIIALRFAGDEELVVLIEKAIQENTIAKDIKKSIKNWKADYHRV